MAAERRRLQGQRWAEVAAGGRAGVQVGPARAVKDHEEQLMPQHLATGGT